MGLHLCTRKAPFAHKYTQKDTGAETVSLLSMAASCGGDGGLHSSLESSVLLKLVGEGVGDSILGGQCMVRARWTALGL